MKRNTKKILLAAVVITVAILVVWQITGGDYYTKYEVVEQVETELDPNDPLVAAGFYESNIVTETVTRDAFRLGLLPTPSGIFDKHVISVVSLLGPVWALTLFVSWRTRRRLKTAG